MCQLEMLITTKFHYESKGLLHGFILAFDTVVSNVGLRHVVLRYFL